MTQTSNGSVGAAPADQVMEFVTRGQKALSGAEGATRQSGGDAFPTAEPSLGEAVDRWVDTGIAVLEMQRSVAHQVLDALRLR